MREKKVTSDKANTWMRDKYYQRSTAYRLFLPIAYSKLLSQKLSEMDITLEPKIGRKYAALSLFGEIFVNHFELARVQGFAIDYNPYSAGIEEGRNKELGPMEFYQGLVRGDSDTFVSAMISADFTPKNPVEWYVFEKELKIPQSPVSRAYAPLREILVDFYPTTHPVVWRALLAFLILSEFYIKAKQFTLKEYDELMSKLSWENVDFRPPEDKRQNGDVSVRMHFEAARAYIRTKLEQEYEVFKSGADQY